MARINHTKMRRELMAARVDGREELFYNDLREGLQEQHIRPEEFSIRELFEEMIPDGRELIKLFNPRHGGDGITLMEAGGAVDTSAFSNITGQIVYTRVLEAFQDPAFLWPSLVDTIPTQFNGEKIPGIGRIGDQATSIGEGEPYPLAGLSEEWIETPETTKRGLIVPVTKEAIFFDRTGFVLRRAAEVAFWLGQNKEKRVLDMVFGITNSYKRNGISYDTYLSSGAYTNIKTANALADYTSIEQAELLFDALLDPNTEEPISVMPNTLIVPTALKHTARRIISSTEIRQGDITTGSGIQTVSANPIGNQYAVRSGPMVKSRSGSATTWFIGEPMRAFAYMENWPITVVQAPNNSEAEFSQDIVVRFKVSERGAPAVLEPRRMIKCTA